MSNKRLYTEKEISRIIRRAGEIQASEREKVTMGLSLDEIQQLADEVGLEPDIIASVAESIDLEPEPVDKGFFESLIIPSKINLEHIIQGDISEDDWHEINALMERVAGKDGEFSRMGKVTEWTTETNNTNHKLNFIPGPDQTKIMYTGNYARLAMSWSIPFLANIGFWSIFFGLLWLGWTGVPLAVGVTFLSYVVIQKNFKKYMSKKRVSLRNTFLSIKRLVEERPASEHGRIEIPQDVYDEKATSGNKRVLFRQ